MPDTESLCESPSASSTSASSPSSTSSPSANGTPAPSKSTSKETQSNLKKHHVCPVCARGFSTTGHLARHARVHTGERNHKCPFPGCDTRCSRQDNLQQHYRIHLSPGSRRRSGRSVLRSRSLSLTLGLGSGSGGGLATPGGSPPPLVSASLLSHPSHGSVLSASASFSSSSSSSHSSGDDMVRETWDDLPTWEERERARRERIEKLTRETPPLTPPPLEDSRLYFFGAHGVVMDEEPPDVPPPLVEATYVPRLQSYEGGWRKPPYTQPSTPAPDTPPPLVDAYPQPPYTQPSTPAPQSMELELGYRQRHPQQTTSYRQQHTYPQPSAPARARPHIDTSASVVGTRASASATTSYHSPSTAASTSTYHSPSASAYPPASASYPSPSPASAFQSPSAPSAAPSWYHPASAARFPELRGPLVQADARRTASLSPVGVPVARSLATRRSSGQLTVYASSSGQLAAAGRGRPREHGRGHPYAHARPASSSSSQALESPYVEAQVPAYVVVAQAQAQHDLHSQQQDILMHPPQSQTYPDSVYPHPQQHDVAMNGEGAYASADVHPPTQSHPVYEQDAGYPADPHTDAGYASADADSPSPPSSSQHSPQTPYTPFREEPAYAAAVRAAAHGYAADPGYTGAYVGVERGEGFGQHVEENGRGYAYAEEHVADARYAVDAGKSYARYTQGYEQAQPYAAYDAAGHAIAPAAYVAEYQPSAHPSAQHTSAPQHQQPASQPSQEQHAYTYADDEYPPAGNAYAYPVHHSQQAPQQTQQRTHYTYSAPAPDAQYTVAQVPVQAEYAYPPVSLAGAGAGVEGAVALHHPQPQPANAWAGLVR